MELIRRKTNWNTEEKFTKKKDIKKLIQINCAKSVNKIRKSWEIFSSVVEIKFKKGIKKKRNQKKEIQFWCLIVRCVVLFIECWII